MDWLIGPPVKAKSGRFAGVSGKKEVTGWVQMKENAMTQLQMRSKRRQDLGDGKTSAAETRKILKYFLGFCKFFLAASSPALPTLSMPT
jgi:hypothetical protein